MPRGKKPNFFRPSTPQELGLTLILGLALLLASYLLIVRFQESGRSNPNNSDNNYEATTEVIQEDTRHYD